MKSADNMRVITQQMERSSQEQAEGGRQTTDSIEHISDMVRQLHDSHGKHAESSEQTLLAANRIQELTREYERRVRGMNRALERLRQLRLGT
jgi:methyl-accepting chemotaxis protein